jgi:Flp pilus assembly pilin Flp
MNTRRSQRGAVAVEWALMFAFTVTAVVGCVRAVDEGVKAAAPDLSVGEIAAALLQEGVRLARAAKAPAE